MARIVTQFRDSAHERLFESTRHIALTIGATLFVALCAHVSIPLMPLTPVPLTVQNFGVLLVGLLLGSRRGSAAMTLYLLEGLAGLPVFNPGPGGIAQLFGVTGGFLLAYPLVAFVAGYIFERGTKKSFARAAMAACIAEIVLFSGGLAWLYVATHSLARAAYLGLYWFVGAEVIKVMFAAAVAARWRCGALKQEE